MLNKSRAPIGGAALLRKNLTPQQLAFLICAILSLYFPLRQPDLYRGVWSVSGRVDETFAREMRLAHKWFGIKKFALTSWGGDSLQGRQIAQLVADEEIAITAQNHCVSACALIFLASSHRTIGNKTFVAYLHSDNGILKLILDSELSLTEFNRGRSGLPSLEEGAAHESRSVGRAGTALLLEAMTHVLTRDPQLKPCRIHGVRLEAECLIPGSWISYWIPTATDYARLGIAVRYIGTPASGAEAWRELFGGRAPKTGRGDAIMYGDKIISSPN